jgi:hypothetical protein
MSTSQRFPHTSRNSFHSAATLCSLAANGGQLLPGGGAVIGSGSDPYYTECDADGEMILDGRLESGTPAEPFHRAGLVLLSMCAREERKGTVARLCILERVDCDRPLATLTGKNRRYLNLG